MGLSALLAPRKSSMWLASTALFFTSGGVHGVNGDNGNSSSPHLVVSPGPKLRLLNGDAVACMVASAARRAQTRHSPYSSQLRLWAGQPQGTEAVIAACATLLPSAALDGVLATRAVEASRDRACSQTTQEVCSRCVPFFVDGISVLHPFGAPCFHRAKVHQESNECCCQANQASTKHQASP